MKLLVGLGNPGESYAFTRHNAGFLIIENYCHTKGGSSFSHDSKFFADIAKISKNEINQSDTILIKPMTYMNLSGKAVKAVSNFYKIKPEDILVIHDEIDLALGDIKYKDGGGHAGHNGLKDIIKELGTNTFKRIRIGIGRPINEQMSVSDYVLGKFIQREREIIEDKYEEIRGMIDNFMR